MNTIFPKLRKTCAAFTLSEMMIATTIGVSLLGMATLSSVGLMKNFASATAYRNVHNDARKALASMNRDFRASTNLTAFASDDITLTVMDISGTAATCRYRLVNGVLQRTYTLGATTTTKDLTKNVTGVTFERWNNPGTTATSNTDTYELRVALTVTNTSAFHVVTDLLQTRVLMRNKY